jgi:hypothetical protein
VTQAPRPAAEGIDTTVAHSPRIWNYWLGGKDNFAVDRQIGDQFATLFPQIVDIARSSRAFLDRAVTFMAESGVRQFLDVGTGLPAERNTHEVAHAAAPDARVVYVDNDPMVLAHARVILAAQRSGGAVPPILDVDLHDPDRVLAEASAHLDLDRPVGLILMNILGHVADLAEAREIVARLVRGLAPGSYLAVADGTNVVDGPAFDRAIALWNEAGSLPYHLRKPQEIEQFFEGLELIEPGVVSCSLWRPGVPVVGTDGAVDEFCGVGRKADPSTASR